MKFYSFRNKNPRGNSLFAFYLYRPSWKTKKRWSVISVYILNNHFVIDNR